MNDTPVPVPPRHVRRWDRGGMELHCDTCARQRTFEQPACAEHPRSSCPDRACTTCGAAIVIAPVIMLMDRRARVLLTRAGDRTAA